MQLCNFKLLPQERRVSQLELMKTLVIKLAENNQTKCFGFLISKKHFLYLRSEEMMIINFLHSDNKKTSEMAPYDHSPLQNQNFPFQVSKKRTFFPKRKSSCVTAKRRTLRGNQSTMVLSGVPPSPVLVLS